MSAISRPTYRPQNRPKEFIVAARARVDGVGRHKGHLVCGHCGMGGMSMADFAAEIGVSVRDVSAFLDKRTLRPDVAATIRANVLRVVE